MKRILILATLDTKNKEAGILLSFVEEQGCSAQILDCSLRGECNSAISRLRTEMFKSAGITEKYLDTLDKSEALSLMTEMVRHKVISMYQQHQLDGAVGIGGVQGTLISTGAMQALPVGVPKLVLSAVANGNTMFGPLVGMSDMMIMHSVVDVAGSNRILRQMMSNAAAAVCGMANSAPLKESAPEMIGITMGGVTTKCGSYIKDMLEQQGYDAVIFHCNGIGAMAMEKLAGEGKISGVIDLTPHDVTDYLFKGMMPASEDRYKILEDVSVPSVIIPGCADIILFNGMENVPQIMRDRKLTEHNKIHTHVKADYEEMYRLGRFIAGRANRFKGPCRILIPELGCSQKNCPGGPLYEPESDRGFADAVMKYKEPPLTAQTFPFHINDREFAGICVNSMLDMLEGSR